ncbi:ATP-binding protein [Pullulanibacillus sp. KACC 23026]|uniref:sensor histidine kinase n=1 Tax=Pullulanibacillus sp. KACC 23026 TaxID=3028315 RepID=UPI0023B0E851|nr:ATP-binding protein [Pullulanibacillus sp. KACC 23026]WEG12566.1 ATP-binding protein [Pullulanibacillus sp. KACC 23026]
MFRRTLFKLTLLNTAIFLVILALLSTSVYFYTKSYVYSSINQQLFTASNHFAQGVEIRGQQTGLLIWNSNNKLILAPSPRVGFSDNTNNSNSDASLLETFKNVKPSEPGKFVNYKAGGDYYRIFILPTKVIYNGSYVKVGVYMFINPYIQVLHTLLVILIAFMIIGLLLAFGAGWFLAHRALKPIQLAWDRQQQFVADASHELRTPLTIIQSRIEMLLQSPRAMIQEKVQDISTSLQETRRLSKLVSHLLTLARSDANQIEMGAEPVLMNELIRTVAEPFAELASFDEKEIALEMGHQPITVLGDKERLHQLLVIFLDNALKFTTEGDKITVACRQESNNVLLEIKDTGIGIKPENLKRIFDRFFQVDTSRTDREGTGLGLSIAKWIVDKHKGKLNVESEFGKGTTFTIQFPAYKPNHKEEKEGQ